MSGRAACCAAPVARVVSAVGREPPPSRAAFAVPIASRRVAHAPTGCPVCPDSVNSSGASPRSERSCPLILVQSSQANEGASARARRASSGRTCPGVHHPRAGRAAARRRSIPPHVKRAPSTLSAYGFATRSSDHSHRAATLAITPTSIELGSAPSRPRRCAPTAEWARLRALTAPSAQLGI